MNKIVLIILVLLTTCLKAQIGSYNIYPISPDNGLLTDDFQFVCQDSYGYLWLASYDGLLRWDGYTFKKYYHADNDSSSLTNNIVYSIYEDSQKRLWIGTIEGLNVYDRDHDRFIACTLNKRGQRIPINAIVEDTRQNLWLGTSHGLCCYNLNTAATQWYVNGSDNVVFKLAIDHDDNLWLGTFTAGIKKFDTHTQSFRAFTFSAGNRCTKITSLLVDYNNRVWIGTGAEGIRVLTVNGQPFTSFTLSTGNEKVQNTVACLYQDKSKNIWIGTDRGKVLLFPKEGVKPEVPTCVLQQSGGFEFESVSSVCEDTFGNTWFATKGNGLFYTNAGKNVFKNYLNTPRQIKNLNSTVITSFLEDRHHNLWIGTDRGGFLKADAGGNTYTSFSTITHALSSNTITDIIEDRTGKLWISTWSGGVMSFDPQTEQIIKFQHQPGDSNSLPINDVKTLLPDDSLLWIGTHGQGLVVCNLNSKKITTHPFDKSVAIKLKDAAWINHLFKDSRSRLWISTYNGVYTLKDTTVNHFAHSTDSTSISSNAVNMVTEDATGTLWLISETGGLDRFDEKKKMFVRFNRANMPQSMKAIVIDKNNLIWISTNEGLIAFNGNKIVNQYTLSDGLPSNSFYHKAVLKTQSGNLLFGSTKGFSVFHPDSFKQVHTPTYFYTSVLTVNNKIQMAGKAQSLLQKDLSFTNTITLQPEQSFFSIELVNINLKAPYKTQYAYKVDELNRDWVLTGAERKLSFTNLNPGTYTMHFKFMAAGSDWQEGNKILTIVVLPPWYKTLWFKWLCALTFALAIVAVFYIRVMSIKRRNIFLKEQVAKRTRELFDANNELRESNEQGQLQKRKLEEVNSEIRRQSEKILEQQYHITSQNYRLEQSVEELKAANHTKDHFFSILAHDLKNPIAALTGISDFMRKNFFSLSKKDAVQYLSSIYNSSQAIYDLLTNLLNWATTQSKTIRYEPVQFKINEIICRNLSLLEQQFKNKHIAIRIECSDDDIVFADYNMVDMIVRNLISNSIKFTEYNGHIVIGVKASETSVDLTIVDDGVGMTHEQVTKLFHLDKNNISTGTAGEKGTGLGLVIVQEFIKINKGTLLIKSELGEGTTVYLSLPKSFAAVKPVLQIHSHNPTHSDSSFEFLDTETRKLINGKKILLIEDHAEVRMYLRIILSDIFEVSEAGNGSEGLVKAKDLQPDVIITDLVMPVMNGFECCYQLKKDGSTSHIPIIVLTSQWEEEVQVKGYEAGADIYLKKPIGKELLLQVITTLVKSREKLRARIRENIRNDQTEEVAHTGLSKTDQQFLSQLMEVVNNHIADATLDARKICTEIGVSRTILYGKVKSITGQSVHELIKSVRLSRSIKLLRDGEMSINQIATETGFNSHSYFDRCFIKQYGVSPKEYEIRCREKLA